LPFLLDAGYNDGRKPVESRLALPRFDESVASGKTNMKTKLLAALGFVAVAGLVVSQTSLLAQTCAINTSSTYQTMDGFGASSAFADPVSMTSAQAATLFGRNNGQIGLSLWRIRIDPNEDWSTETTNAAFAHQWGARVLGTPWTPPASMKSNTNTIGGTLNTSEYAAYASYLNLAAKSIGLDYVSMQNEPDANVSYESCFWTGTNMENWCASNAPAVGRPIVMPESESFDYSFSDPTLDNSTAANNVTIVAGHIYGGFPLSGPYTNALEHGKHIWMTEHYNEPTTNLETAVYTAWEISQCMNEQMSAYIWWRAYHPALAIDDLINGTTPIVTGYMVAQFASFIRPGYVMVGATFNPSPGVFVTAYTGGGTLVVVAVNTNSLPVTQGFSISGMSVPLMIPTVTSSNLSMAQVTGIPVKSGIFDATLPALSTATFVSVAPPTLVHALHTNGTFQFSFTGSPPLQYTVMTATNPSLRLSNWTVAGSATNTGSNNYTFSVPLATNQSAQFYSVQIP
jgi:glucuronoarabinoxylan endo-1,4-beta-xylanase